MRWTPSSTGCTMRKITKPTLHMRRYRTSVSSCAFDGAAAMGHDRLGSVLNSARHDRGGTARQVRQLSDEVEQLHAALEREVHVQRQLRDEMTDIVERKELQISQLKLQLDAASQRLATEYT